jgi:SAM-dependent methyltransferase
MSKSNFEQIAKNYAKIVDAKPIHVYYERPNLLALLPRNLIDLRVLDLGCGSGWYAEHLINHGAKVTAIDSSQTMVQLTKQRVPSCRVYLADLEEPLECLRGNHFDIVLAPLVIHYIKDWFQLFERLADFLRPDGNFVFSTHSPHTEFEAFGLKNYFKKVLITDYWENIGEVKFYHHTLHELTEALYQAGFVVERIQEPMPLPEMEQADPKMYRNLTTKPWFLFIRAVKK